MKISRDEKKTNTSLQIEHLLAPFDIFHELYLFGLASKTPHLVSMDGSITLPS